MNKLSMCRICRVEDGLHSIADTVLEDLYEKLTATPFHIDDGRPLQVCYICCARLKNCYHLQASCLQSEKLFTQVLNYEITSTLVQNNTFKIIHPVIRLSCAPVTRTPVIREMSDHNYANMDHSVLIDDQVQIKEEKVEDAQDNFTDQDFTMKYTGQEDIVKTEDDVSSYYTLIKDTGCNWPSESADQSVEHDTDLKYKIQSMESQDDLHSDHSTASTELLTVRMVSNIRDMDFIKPGTLAAKEQKPDLAKIQAQSTGQAETRYQQFSNKINTIAKILVDKCVGCNPSQINKDIKNAPYKCDICKKHFSKNSNLRKHMSIHTGEKPYICVTCKKRFRRRDSLKSHLRVHSSEKPYSCDICRKCFRCKPNLKSHLRVHSGDKQYNCYICKRCFRYKADLKNHLCIHTGEK